MISVDNWLNETTRHAHVILPGLSRARAAALRRAASGAARSAARRKYSPPVFPPADGRPHEWEILIRLAGACLGQPAAEVDVAAHRRRLLRRAGAMPRGSTAPTLPRAGYDARRARAAARPHDPHRPVRRPLRRAPRRAHARARSKAEPARHRPRARWCRASPRCSRPPSGKIELAPPYITADLPRLAARLDRPADGLVLVSRRHLRSNNSWMHNVQGAGEGQGPLHAARPPRRRRRAAASPTATLAAVSSEAGQRRGAGRGERRDDARRRVAARTAGATTSPAPGCRSPASTPASTTTCSRPATFVDVLSGNAAVNGIP